VTALAPAAPNPFRRATTFAIDLAQPAHVELALYAVDGRRVRTLVDDQREAGRYDVAWDGRDSRGDLTAPGVYYARFVSGSTRFTRRIVLLP
jgi:flagellar hook assembly protein FlgD